ncbi:uncharacterized protein LY89DRAFT_487874 [Mollisia scopiformis]|uniref:Homeobox domain-containing protein n=1 Tax=Mollisia scopiformis TaxID=149040 RepID=A0A194XGK5_MOLSC|nr:uncharacterized protein LY89DRAFT_487874 [Mollisia scopiformis]KUJ19271.1 hypothetical protein LY89DRAFT_487874 [Mollisia scopiformis]
MSRRRDQSILPMPPVITTRPRNLHRHAFTDITPPRKLTEAECKEKLTSYTAYSIRKAPSPLFEHLWSRSDSSNNEKSTSSFSSSAVSKATQGDEIFQDVRRFVVLKKGSYTVALPITTYASKGHRHGDINMKEHCIIYNNRKPEETPAPTTDKIQGSHSKSMNWAPFERSSSHNQHSSAFAAAGAWMEDSYYSFGLRPSPSSSSSNGAKRKHHFPSYHNHDPVNFDDQDVLETLQNGWETFLGSGTAGDRPRLGREEVEILEASFKKNPKPTIQTKRRFSEDMGIELSRINNWFQNRRAKRKQEKKFEALAASEGPSLHELHSPPNTISTESQAGSTSIFKPLTSLSPTFELVQIDDTQSIDEVTIIQSHPLDFIASQNLH